MAKESKKQIKAQAINECAKQFRSRIENLESRLKAQVQINSNLVKENVVLKEENIKLKEQLEKYEDWNRRLQEFMDMTPEEREKIIQDSKLRISTNERLNKIMDMFQHFTIF